MSSKPTHSYFGTPLDEWVACYPNELETDLVGLWEIVADLRKGFGLQGDILENATREILTALLNRGAEPITGSLDKPGTWEKVTRYGDHSKDIVDAVIAEWRASGRDPDVEDVWFGLPGSYDAC
jgi:hypothetical protein